MAERVFAEAPTYSKANSESEFHASAKKSTDQFEKRIPLTIDDIAKYNSLMDDAEMIRKGTHPMIMDGKDIVGEPMLIDGRFPATESINADKRTTVVKVTSEFCINHFEVSARAGKKDYDPFNLFGRRGIDLSYAMREYYFEREGTLVVVLLADMATTYDVNRRQKSGDYKEDGKASNQFFRTHLSQQKKRIKELVFGSVIPVIEAALKTQNDIFGFEEYKPVCSTSVDGFSEKFKEYESLLKVAKKESKLIDCHTGDRSKNEEHYQTLSKLVRRAFLDSVIKPYIDQDLDPSNPLTGCDGKPDCGLHLANRIHELTGSCIRLLHFHFNDNTCGEKEILQCRREMFIIMTSAQSTIPKRFIQLLRTEQECAEKQEHACAQIEELVETKKELIQANEGCEKWAAAYKNLSETQKQDRTEADQNVEQAISEETKLRERNELQMHLSKYSDEHSSIGSTLEEDNIKLKDELLEVEQQYDALRRSSKELRREYNLKLKEYENLDTKFIGLQAENLQLREEHRTLSVKGVELLQARTLLGKKDEELLQARLRHDAKNEELIQAYVQVEEKIIQVRLRLEEKEKELLEAHAQLQEKDEQLLQARTDVKSLQAGTDLESLQARTFLEEHCNEVQARLEMCTCKEKFTDESDVIRGLREKLDQANADKRRYRTERNEAMYRLGKVQKTHDKLLQKKDWELKSQRASLTTEIEKLTAKLNKHKSKSGGTHLKFNGLQIKKGGNTRVKLARVGKKNFELTLEEQDVLSPMSIDESIGGTFCSFSNTSSSSTRFGSPEKNRDSSFPPEATGMSPLRSMCSKESSSPKSDKPARRELTNSSTNIRRRHGRNETHRGRNVSNGLGSKKTQAYKDTHHRSDRRGVHRTQSEKSRVQPETSHYRARRRTHSEESVRTGAGVKIAEYEDEDSSTHLSSVY